jgi:hypothetical protein
MDTQKKNDDRNYNKREDKKDEVRREHTVRSLAPKSVVKSDKIST